MPKEEKLAYTFHLSEKLGHGATRTYRKGTPKSSLPPDVAEALSGNPIAFTTDDIVPSSATLSAVDTETAPAPQPVAPAVPPLAGKGSGINAWRGFAEDHLAEVPDTWTRDEIVAHLQDEGIIGEDGALIE